MKIGGSKVGVTCESMNRWLRRPIPQLEEVCEIQSQEDSQRTGLPSGPGDDHSSRQASSGQAQEEISRNRSCEQNGRIVGEQREVKEEEGEQHLACGVLSQRAFKKIRGRGEKTEQQCILANFGRQRNHWWKKGCQDESDPASGRAEGVRQRLEDHPEDNGAVNNRGQSKT